MRIALVVGARPNIVKAAALVSALRAAGATVTVVHTGQHADEKMSGELFRELRISPDIHLNMPEGRTAAQRFASMIGNLVSCFDGAMEPDLVMVVGDCDSTLAGALAAKKCGLRLAHVEAGLRATDVVQENLNRVLVDHASELLFSSEPDAIRNLCHEGLTSRAMLVGNVMIDALKKFLPQAQGRPLPADLKRGEYAVLTLHRAENVDTENLWKALAAASIVCDAMPVFFPMHPRTIKAMGAPPHPLIGWNALSYLDFINVLSGAKLVLTDSGGVQEETTALGVPCLTLREQTERPATITDGTNELVGFDAEKVRESLDKILRGEWKLGRGPELWDGRAAERIADVLVGERVA